MHHLMVSKRGNALVILESPSFEMMARGVLKIAVTDLRWVVRNKLGALAMHDKKRVTRLQAFSIIAVMGAAHNNGDQIQMILLGGIPQFWRFFRRDIPGKDHAVVAFLGCFGETGDHPFHLIGIVHLAPNEKPSFFKPGIGGVGLPNEVACQPENAGKSDEETTVPLHASILRSRLRPLEA